MDQPYLFPLSDVQTKGYAQPESRWGDIDDNTSNDEQQAEAA
ncbi:hypothetical protein [Streptomyces sp. PD-S100-1]